MQAKIIKTTLAEYKIAEYNGKNESGWTPIGDRVLILPDLAAEQRASGLHVDARTVERNSLAAENGTVIEVGDSAFLWNSDRTRPFNGQKPMPGDRVNFERFAGQLLLGDDNQLYRIMDDRCIASVRATQ